MGPGTNSEAGLMADPGTKQRQSWIWSKAKAKGQLQIKGEGTANASVNADEAALHHRDRQRLARRVGDIHHTKRLER